MGIFLAVMALLVAEPPNHTLAELAWLSGSWEGTLGKARIEEHWIAPEGGMLLGVSRTIVGEKTVAFEFLRIETRADGIYYVAHPNARPGTDFKLTQLLGDTAVFENPQHDHPKMIRYQKNADGSLHVQIEGDEKGKHVVEDFDFKRGKN